MVVVVTHVIMRAIGSAGCSAMSVLTTSTKTFRYVAVASYVRARAATTKHRVRVEWAAEQAANQERRFIVGEANFRSFCQRTTSWFGGGGVEGRELRVRACRRTELATSVRQLPPSSSLSSSAGFSLSCHAHKSRPPPRDCAARPRPPPSSHHRLACGPTRRGTTLPQSNQPRMRERRGVVRHDDRRSTSARAAEEPKRRWEVRALSISLFLRYSFHESCCAAATSALITAESAIRSRRLAGSGRFYPSFQDLTHGCAHFCFCFCG